MINDSWHVNYAQHDSWTGERMNWPSSSFECTSDEHYSIVSCDLSIRINHRECNTTGVRQISIFVFILGLPKLTALRSVLRNKFYKYSIYLKFRIKVEIMFPDWTLIKKNMLHWNSTVVLLTLKRPRLKLAWFHEFIHEIFGIIQVRHIYVTNFTIIKAVSDNAFHISWTRYMKRIHLCAHAHTYVDMIIDFIW